MRDLEFLCGDLIEECFDSDPAFKQTVMKTLKNKIMDAVNELALKDIVQSQSEEMIQYLFNEDSELLDNIRDELSELICDKLEVRLKDESIY